MSGVNLQTELELLILMGKLLLLILLFCKLFDKPEKELINQPFYVLYHPNIHGEIIKEYKNDISHNNIKAQLERNTVLWNGRKVWVEFTNSVIKNFSNNKLILSIVRDISEKKETNCSLQKVSDNIEHFLIIQVMRCLYVI